jgi:hypothetical protein
MEKEGRILSNNWSDYTADKVVFKPKLMSPERLQELYFYAWDTFYAEKSYQFRMGDLFMKVIEKEMKDGTYRRNNPRASRKFKKKVLS